MADWIAAMQNERLWSITIEKAGVAAIVEKYAPNEEVANTKLLYLERGNEAAGLHHIWQQHGQNFKDKFKVTNEDDCSKYIKFRMEFGLNSTHGYQKDNVHGGFAIMYQVDEKNCLIVVFGSNGFIVSAYPSTYNNSEAEMEKWPYF